MATYCLSPLPPVTPGTCHTYLSHVWHIKNNTEQRGTSALTANIGVIQVSAGHLRES